MGIQIVFEDIVYYLADGEIGVPGWTNVGELILCFVNLNLQMQSFV